MEISRLSDTGIRIKTKNVTIAVDPSTKTEADVVIITGQEQDGAIPEDTKLIVEGPGDYEVGGVHMTGKKVGDIILYTMFDDYFRILLAPISAVAKVASEDDVDAVIIAATTPLTKKDLSTISADAVLVYGKPENVPATEDGFLKMPRVNLKKKEEIKGNIVYLGS